VGTFGSLDATVYVFSNRRKMDECTGVARGCTGCTCPFPRAQKKIGAKFTGKNCKCAFLGRAKSQFFKDFFCWAGKIWTVGMVNLAVLACVLSVTTKKKSLIFSRKKVHPRENPGYAYG